MLSAEDLTSIARVRLQDAKVLFSSKRYDGAVYLCGYAVEIAVKARIVKTLKWPGFPENNREFEGLQSFRSHDLPLLLKLSGWEPRINANYGAEWSKVVDWNPESRYQRPRVVPEAQAQAEANEMIESARKLVGVML